MLRTWARRVLTPAALAAALTLTALPAQAATVPGEPGASVAAYSSTGAGVTVYATGVGWAHTISGMAAQLCGRSTPSLWRSIARDNGIADPDRVNLGQRLVVRCVAGGAPLGKPAPSTTPATPAAASSWVAPVTGVIWVSGDGKVGGRGGCWLAQRSGHLHQGIDIMRSRGTAIRAVHAGRVRVSRYSVNSRGVGAGWYVMVDHGSYQSVYMHMRGRSLLRVGAKVTAGQVVGYVGSSGAGVAHLHFEIHHGARRPVNPMPFLRAHGIAVKGC